LQSEVALISTFHICPVQSDLALIGYQYIVFTVHSMLSFSVIIVLNTTSHLLHLSTLILQMCQSVASAYVSVCAEYVLFVIQIMLGLTTHEPHFSLLREEVRFTGKNSQKRSTAPEETTFHLLHLSLMREYLEFEFGACIKVSSTFSFTAVSNLYIGCAGLQIYGAYRRFVCNITIN